MPKYVELVDLVKSKKELCNEYLLSLEKIGFGTAENEPFRVTCARIYIYYTYENRVYM